MRSLAYLSFSHNNYLSSDHKLIILTSWLTVPHYFSQSMKILIETNRLFLWEPFKLISSKIKYQWLNAGMVRKERWKSSHTSDKLILWNELRYGRVSFKFTFLHSVILAWPIIPLIVKPDSSFSFLKEKGEQKWGQRTGKYPHKWDLILLSHHSFFSLN